MSCISPTLIRPVSAIGENAPALAPVQIMIAISKGLIPARAATAMPIGAIMAVPAMLPGPIAEKTRVIKKKITGSRAGCP